MSDPEVLKNKQERQSKAAELLISIIESRELIDKKISEHPDTHHSYRLNGIQIDSLNAPDTLHTLLLPINQSAEAAIEASYSSEPHIDAITIHPCDQASILLRAEQGGLITAENPDGISVLEMDTLDTCSQIILPIEYRGEDVPIDKLLEFAHQRSPENHITRTLKQVDNETQTYSLLETTEVEAVDDSIYSLAVLRLKKHPSGQLAGTRMTITESLLERTKAASDKTINYGFNVEVVSGTSIEDLKTDEKSEFESDLDTLFNNKNTAVLSVTARHLDDVRTVLSELTSTQL